jgi:hypothetical protein
MIGRVAWRSLCARPVRTAALAAGFGLGISVMAALLGVGEVVLEQATSPALRGGGEVILLGVDGKVRQARWLLQELHSEESNRLGIEAAAPQDAATLYLQTGKSSVPVLSRWGVPSLDRALQDPEIASLTHWQDGPGDTAWSNPGETSVRLALDRFHPAPQGGRWDDSWAEWLYFNGKGDHGRFYLTYICGPWQQNDRRSCGIHLQLQEDGIRKSYGAQTEIAEQELLSRAPQLEWGSNRIQIRESIYRLDLDLTAADGSSLRGTLELDARSGAAFPPFTIRGAQGWRSGYVLPVPQGTWRGGLEIDGRRISLDGLEGYHDHNWGQWRGVTWQWGQVATEGVSIVYGRIFPPPAAVESSIDLPALLVATLPDGERVVFSGVSVRENQTGEDGVPSRLEILGGRIGARVELTLDVVDSERTRLPNWLFGSERSMEILQLQADYKVTLKVGERSWVLSARGSAETFRGAEEPLP